MTKDIELVHKFIFNDDVQNILSDINSNLMDFNILEITGMGHQEIKHSNILGWLFEDSEHNLEYQILDGFLKKVIEKTHNKELQEYLYLVDKRRDITVYREKDNIDLLIVDEANKVVITIENKVYASERTDGDDGGQLKKYEKIINKKYKSKVEDKENGYKKYFIYLTIDLEEPLGGKEDWMKANHQMITKVIESILKTKETTTKTTIVLESYVDLLKRNGIVAEDKLKELCEKIWDNKKYREAFEIIVNNRPSKIDVLKNILEDYKELKIIKRNETGGSCTFVIEFNEESPLRYIIQYSTNNRVVKFSIVSVGAGLIWTPRRS